MMPTHNGSEADRLISISSPLSKRVEIHESTVINGIAQMRPLPNSLEIGAGETVELKLSQTHIMFIQPTLPLKEGERFAAKLTFAQAGIVDVEFAVQGIGARPAPAGEHGGHGALAQ